MLLWMVLVLVLGGRGVHGGWVEWVEGANRLPSKRWLVTCLKHDERQLNGRSLAVIDDDDDDDDDVS